MIKSLELKNFKAFSDEHLEFRKITLLAGANSSGKSSILQALAGVLQSFSEPAFPFGYAINGQLTQMGSFRNVVNGHNANNSFSVGIAFENDNQEFVVEGQYRSNDLSPHLFPRRVSLSGSKIGSFKITWNQRAKRFKLEVTSNASSDFDSEYLTIALTNLAQKRGITAQKTIEQLMGEHGNDGSKVLEYLKEIARSTISDSSAGVQSSTADYDSSIREFEKVPYFKNIRDEVLKSLSAMRSSTTYVGPVRAYPSRYYPFAQKPAGLDPLGETMSRTLALWKERKSPRFAEVKKALVSLELASDISAEIEMGEFLKLMIKPGDRAYPDTIADVGFGVSQILPILVSDIALGSSGTLLVNQPEVHLHPSSQALLGSYFAGRLDTRQYIVETHSEYLITRLRLLVARGEISENDVVIYYCGTENDSGKALLSKVSIMKDGSLVGMPKGFFSTYAADTFNLAMAVMDSEDSDAD